jgi:hypothetical protein
MKWFLTFLFSAFITISGYSQQMVSVYYDESDPSGKTEKFRIVKFEQYSEIDFNVVHFLNSHRILVDEDFDELSVRVMSSVNTSSEDDFEYGASTSKIIIAVSEFDEAPTQNLFMIIPLLNPTLENLEAIDDYTVLLSIEYGFKNERMETKFRIKLDEVVPETE